jgi:hypothetical protein
MASPHIRSYQAVLILLSLLAHSACENEPTIRVPPVETWELADPTLVLGALDGGPAAFSPIRDFEIGPSSELHVLLPQEHEVRVFNGDGEYVRSIGRLGEGPGEFSRPEKIGFVGDTLWVLDSRAERVHFFLDGDFVRVLPLPPVRDLRPDRFSRAIGVIAGPRVLISPDAMTYGHPPVLEEPGLLLTYMEGSFDTLATINVDYVGGFAIRRSGGEIEAVRPFPQPFSPATEWAISPGGGSVVLAGGPTDPERSDSVFLVEVSADGDTLLDLRHPFQFQEIPDRSIDSIVAEIAGDRFSDSEVRSATYLPSYYPPVTELIVGEDGTAWIARETLPNRAQQWEVFSSEGTRLAEIVTPPGFEVMWTDGNVVWGLVLDELDVPYLVRRPIMRN